MNDAEVKKWLRWVHLTSIPLCRLGSGDMPTAIASACLVDYRGRRFVLTAAHAVKMGSDNWVLDLGPDVSGRTETYRPSRFLYIKEFHRANASIIDVDLCYAEVALDVAPRYQQQTPHGAMSDSQPCHIFDHSSVAPIENGVIFAFAGKIDPEVHGDTAFFRQPVVYPGLRYKGKTGNCLEFLLPVDHPGHASFHGCSGAPIVDTQRRVVALVSSGERTTNAVYGVPLVPYMFALDFYCDQIGPR